MRYEVWRLEEDHPARHPDDRTGQSNLLIAPDDPRYPRLTDGAEFIEAIEADSYEEIHRIWHGRIFGATPEERLARMREAGINPPSADSN